MLVCVSLQLVKFSSRHGTHPVILCISSVGPEILVRGPNRTEFQNILRAMVDYFAPWIEDRDPEDIYQALDFYYSPWPHIHDPDANRYALGMVRPPPVLTMQTDMP